MKPRSISFFYIQNRDSEISSESPLTQMNKTKTANNPKHSSAIVLTRLFENGLQSSFIFKNIESRSHDRMTMEVNQRLNLSYFNTVNNF